LLIAFTVFSKTQVFEKRVTQSKKNKFVLKMMRHQYKGLVAEYTLFEVCGRQQLMRVAMFPA